MKSYLNWYYADTNCSICTSKLNCFKLNFNLDADPEFIEKYEAICLREFNCDIEDFSICNDCFFNYKEGMPLSNTAEYFFDYFENLLSTEDCIKILG